MNKKLIFFDLMYIYIFDSLYQMFNGQSITITYGDRAENHNGMQIIGKMANRGFSINDLKKCKKKFESDGVECLLVDLNQPLNDILDNYPDVTFDKACVLVIKQGIDHLLSDIGRDSNDMFKELAGLEWDKKAVMYGRVVNKSARYNLCFSDFSQDADYVNGKGTIVSFKDVDCCNEIRKRLPEFIDGSKDLIGEGNNYYSDKCGIGWHGDAERKKVVAAKLGDIKPLNYQWYYKGQSIGPLIQIEMTHGDLYVMSEKAVGTDWKKKNIPTLRHSTGADKYIQ